MKKIITCAVIAAIGLLSAATISPRTIIVKDQLQILPETNASLILAEVLGKMFGAKMKVVDIRQYDKKSPAIILRPAAAKLDQEEWRISSRKDVITIEGGKPLGVLFGVYELLEKFGGCRYFSGDCRYIPAKKSFTLPAGKVFQRKPAFKRRSVYSTRNFDEAACNSWNKLNDGYVALNEDNGISIEQEWFYKPRRVIGGACHTFYFWSKEFPKDKKEYFSLDESGIRLRATSGAGPGQLCLTHPDVRRLIKAKVLREIAKDKAAAGKKGYPRRMTINISHNDNGAKCVCKNCMALAKKYGAYSGVMVDFANDIASCAPDMDFETFAYTFTEEPPKGIKPAKNVVMYLAFLGPELMNGKYDTMRSFSHPNNALVRKYYEEWGKISRLTVWLYQRPYRQNFPSPTAMVWKIGDDFRFLHKNKVIGVFGEAEYDDLNSNIGPRAFHDLHNYLSAKMLDDPYQNDKRLIAEFIKHFYGPAAAEMTAYMNYLEKRMNEEKRMLGKVPEGNRVYMDAAFFETINKLLTKALAKTKVNSLEYKRVAMELMILDLAAAHMWEKLPSLAKVMKLTKKQQLDRLAKYSDIALSHVFRSSRFIESRAEAKKKVLNKIEVLRNPLPVPPQLKNRNIIQHAMAAVNVNSVSDPEAVGGRAVHLGASGRHNATTIQGGIYTHYNKRHILQWKLAPADIPQDEKYHIYHLGYAALPGPETKPVMWAHWSWNLNITESLKSAYKPQDSSRVFDIYYSIKVTGPAYVKGSKKPNGFYVDRVIYAERTDESAAAGTDRKVFNLSEGKCDSSFKLAADTNAPSGKAFIIPLVKGKAMEFGFYSYRTKKVMFRRKFTDTEIKKDNNYQRYPVALMCLPPATEKPVFWGHDSWKLRLNPVLEDLRNTFGTETPVEIEALMRFDGKNIRLARMDFTVPAQLRGKKCMTFPLTGFDCTRTFKMTQDPNVYGGKALQIPLGNKPMEFGFYDYKTKKVIFRTKFANNQFKTDGKYHLYSLGKRTLPQANVKTAFWGHASWGANFTPVLNAAVKQAGNTKEWEIFASVKSDGKNLLINQFIFCSAK